MDRYIDLSVLRDPDFAPQHLLSALFAKLHRALVSLGSNDIGVSFPAHGNSPPTLGDHVRLHGTEDRLESLMALGWTRGLGDLLRVEPIKAVPAASGHRCVQRVQAKSSPERLRRRAMRRHSINAQEAAARIPDSAAESLRLPSLRLASSSTGQPGFLLFVRHGPIQDSPCSGTFSSYGLSASATIPWF